jgi:hypothetical protein
VGGSQQVTNSLKHGRASACALQMWPAPFQDHHQRAPDQGPSAQAPLKIGTASSLQASHRQPAMAQELGSSQSNLPTRRTKPALSTIIQHSPANRARSHPTFLFASELCGRHNGHHERPAARLPRRLPVRSAQRIQHRSPLARLSTRPHERQPRRPAQRLGQQPDELQQLTWWRCARRYGRRVLP